MKKLFSILLCVGLLIGIAGCGNAAQETAEETSVTTELKQVRETAYVIESQGDEERIDYDGLRVEDPGEYDQVWLCIEYNSDGTVNDTYSLYYRYNENGDITYRAGYTGGVEFGREYYVEYDEQGREAKYYYTNEDGSTMTTVDEYTDDTHYTATTTYTAEGEDTVVSSFEYVNEFDENGNCIKKTVTNMDDGSVTTYTYSYNENGDVIETVVNYDSYTMTTTNTYDKNNNLIESVDISNDPDDYYSYRTVYEYE